MQPRRSSVAARPAETLRTAHALGAIVRRSAEHEAAALRWGADAARSRSAALTTRAAATIDRAPAARGPCRAGHPARRRTARAPRRAACAVRRTARAATRTTGDGGIRSESPAGAAAAIFGAVVRSAAELAHDRQRAENNESRCIHYPRHPSLPARSSRAASSAPYVKMMSAPARFRQSRLSSRQRS